MAHLVLLALSANHDDFAKDHDELSGSHQQLALSLNPGLLHKLGGGTNLGNRIHDALEQIIGNGRQLDEIERGEEAADFRLAIEQILATPIQLPGIAKAEALQRYSGSAIAELHFMLPVEQLTPRILRHCWSIR